MLMNFLLLFCYFTAALSPCDSEMSTCVNQCLLFIDCGGSCQGNLIWLSNSDSLVNILSMLTKASTALKK